MPRRNLIVGSSTNKRFIHPDLMIGKDVRKAMGSGPSFLIQVETSRGEFSTLERPKKCVI